MGRNAPDPANTALSSALAEYGALLELSGAGYYAARAFRKGADLIAATPLPVAELVREGRVRELRGIGPGIEARLRELVNSGQIAELEELRRTVSPELAALSRLLGFSAKRGVEIGAALGIRTGDEFRAAAAAGRLREVPGIGPRREAALRAALEQDRPAPVKPLRLDRARAVLDEIAGALGGIPAGDPRRWKDSPTRLAVVVASTTPGVVQAQFASLAQIVASVRPDLGVTADGTPIELVVAPPVQLGTALVRATGSTEYVASLEPLPAAADESTLFRRLGIPFAPPEIRELGTVGPRTRLLELGDVRGDLHCHTTSSDGKATVREMADAARRRGYEFLAICDHTTAVRVVPGLDAEGLRRQAAEIAEANLALEPFRVLRGIECDILTDGSLDLPDDVLEELDWVQLSLHAGQRAPRRELTARVTHAMGHPAVCCLSHPTGRLLGHRPENALDLERTIETALETGVALEVNGLPDRLDLSGENVGLAVAAGVKIVCSTDAHSTGGLDNMALSVHTARRGGATADDVLNTRTLPELLTTIHARRSRS